MKKNGINEGYDLPNEGESKSPFKVQTVNQWMYEGLQSPKSRPLFGPILHEFEVAILFANTGKGKSTFSYQIFDAISTGIPMFDLATTKLKGLYIDFELSSSSLVTRYTDSEDTPYAFNDNFLRGEIDYSTIDIHGVSIENGILNHIEAEVVKHKPSVICIDNISFISVNNEKSKDALTLLKGLLKISRSLKVAILVLAHRPKVQDPSFAITLDHLAGSKSLSNFCDVCFAICDSVHSPNQVYIKELKNRNRPITFDTENVIECKIVKDDNFLKFEKIGIGKEADHLIKVQVKDNSRIEEVLALKENGVSNVKIGRKLGVSEGTVRNILKKSL